MRAWLPDDVVPPVNRCHVQAEYPLLPEGVPAQAALTRSDDHCAYFTMAFDHTHDRMDDEQRRQAFDFMAADLRELAHRTATEEALARRCQTATSRRPSLTGSLGHWV